MKAQVSTSTPLEMQAVVSVRPCHVDEDSFPQPMQTSYEIPASGLTLAVPYARGLALSDCVLCLPSYVVTPPPPILSHEHALRAAPSLSIVVAHIHWLDRAGSIRHATALRVTLHLAVVPPDLANDIVESLVDVDS